MSSEDVQNSPTTQPQWTKRMSVLASPTQRPALHPRPAPDKSSVRTPPEMQRDGVRGAGVERRALSMWWDHSTWDLARAAYVAELDDDPPGPGTLLGWVVAAIEAHAARSAAARASLSADMPADDAAAGFQKVHQMTATTLSAIEAAIADDRRSAGRILSRSAWVREAARAAAGATRLRHGGSLPEAPDRLAPGPARGGER